MALWQPRLNSIVLLVICATLPHTKASAQSPEHRWPHFFNAYLQEPQTLRAEAGLLLNSPISLPIPYSTNATYTFNEDWEVGSNALILAIQMPYLYLKHRMFEFANAQTSFVAHGFMFREFNISGDTEPTIEMGRLSPPSVIGSIITSHTISELQSISWGVNFANIILDTPSSSSQLNASALAASAAYDHRLFSFLHLRAVAMIPLYASLDATSLEAKVRASGPLFYDYFRGSLPAAGPYAFASLVLDDNNQQLEIGAMADGWRGTYPLLSYSFTF